MRRLTAFVQVTLDGYFAGPNGDLGWAHRASEDAEWRAFVAGNAKGGGQFVVRPGYLRDDGKLLADTAGDRA